MLSTREPLEVVHSVTLSCCTPVSVTLQGKALHCKVCRSYRYHWLNFKQKWELMLLREKRIVNISKSSAKMLILEKRGKDTLLSISLELRWSRCLSYLEINITQKVLQASYISLPLMIKKSHIQLFFLFLEETWAEKKPSHLPPNPCQILQRSHKNILTGKITNWHGPRTRGLCCRCFKPRTLLVPIWRGSVKSVRWGAWAEPTGYLETVPIPATAFSPCCHQKRYGGIHSTREQWRNLFSSGLRLRN